MALKQKREQLLRPSPGDSNSIIEMSSSAPEPACNDLEGGRGGGAEEETHAVWEWEAVSNLLLLIWSTALRTFRSSGAQGGGSFVPLHSGSQGAEREHKPFHRRVADASRGVALFLSGSAVGLLASPPVSPHNHRTYMAAAYVAFCSGGYLCLFSLVSGESFRVATVQVLLMHAGGVCVRPHSSAPAARDWTR